MQNHYGLSDSFEQVEAALVACGFGQGHIDRNALSALDQFHVGGELATRELADALQIAPATLGLDVGSGLGGPARFLAGEYRCKMIGIDLSSHFVKVANYLSRRTGFDDRVSTVVGNAIELPFLTRSFDFAWTQHVAMNIKERAALYSGIFNVLRPGARFASYDAIAADGGRPIYPVPWSRTAENSFLLGEGEMCEALLKAGFVIRHWTDVTERAVEWRQATIQTFKQQSSKLQKVALRLVMGSDFGQLGANFERNLRERRVRLVQVIAERPVQ